MTARAAPREIGAVLARESLPIVVYSAFVGLLALLVPQLLSSDGWYALVAGRLIAHHGLPQHDTVAALTNGRQWIDQQWLGQLATYWVDAAGGIRLLLAVNVVLVAGALGAAGVYARRRSARPTTVALVLLAVLLPFLVSAMNVRTQSLVYLPFVFLIRFLAQDRTLNGRNAVFVLAVITVWGNVHGSVLLAAGLVALRGAVDLTSSRRNKTAWALLLSPWVCLLVSPYHFHVLSYYNRTAFNASFGKYLSQWAPTTFSPISASLLVLVFMTTWMLGRSGVSYTLYERALLATAIVLVLLAVRNWAFASLILVMLAPHGFDRALRTRAPRPAPAIGAAVGAVAAVAALVGAAVSLAASNAKLIRDYPSAAGLAAADAASRPGAQVYAGFKFSDWLLWAHPELTGKVVVDVRYSLLKTSELKRLVTFAAGSGVGAPLGRPTVYVLDPDLEKDALKGLQPNVRIVYKTDHAVVAVRRNGQ